MGGGRREGQGKDERGKGKMGQGGGIQLLTLP